MRMILHLGEYKARGELAHKAVLLAMEHGIAPAETLRILPSKTFGALVRFLHRVASPDREATIAELVEHHYR